MKITPHPRPYLCDLAQNVTLFQAALGFLFCEGSYGKSFNIFSMAVNKIFLWVFISPVSPIFNTATTVNLLFNSCLQLLFLGQQKKHEKRATTNFMQFYPNLIKIHKS